MQGLLQCCSTVTNAVTASVAFIATAIATRKSAFLLWSELFYNEKFLFLWCVVSCWWISLSFLGLDHGEVEYRQSTIKPYFETHGKVVTMFDFSKCDGIIWRISNWTHYTGKLSNIYISPYDPCPYRMALFMFCLMRPGGSKGEGILEIALDVVGSKDHSNDEDSLCRPS